ncbi:cell envelope integrity protein TolA [Vibrio sp. JC009]|uniref:cell envelope integrity protein TolA n=1 Tax=Vibrio sp. JC009 TaxID=2912314 RepID=UPI0023B17DE7|nr:cell envelope integrity protein TolA [Vibrio sp. JC009]WED22774.1 cell envelope integrity protein TolA [Vibrio sp. JC009]
MKSDKNYTKEILISVVLHLLLVVALVWGTDFNMSKPEPSGKLMQAVVIDPQLVKKQAQEIRRSREAAAKAEQERLDKLRKQSEQLEKNRKAEEERIRKLREQKAKADKATREAEKKRKAEQERVKQEQARVKKEQQRLKAEREKAAKVEAERKKKQEAIKRAEAEQKAKQAAIAKAEAERVAKEKAAKEAEEKLRIEREKAAKAEKERIAKEKAAKEAAEKARLERERLEQLERERKEQEAALGDIFSGLQQESAQNMSAKERHVVSETDRYGAIYTQLIQNNLLVEESFKGKTCRVNLRLLPTGTDMILSDVKVLEGDTRLCSATKRAVAQVGSFPLPKESDVVEKVRNINLTVAPE